MIGAIFIPSPLLFRGGVGSGGCQDSAASANNPHPNRSPEGAGLNTDHDLRWNDKAVDVL